MASTSKGLAETCELFELSVRLVEQRFRRDNPDATDAEVAARVRAWMLDRSVAPKGDYAGSPPT